MLCSDQQNDREPGRHLFSVAEDQACKNNRLIIVYTVFLLYSTNVGKSKND